jgi:hypothetical protein
MKPRYQSFTRIGRQSQSLKRQVYADWTSVSFPLCKPLHGQYKFEHNHEKKIKNMANSMQYIVGANCFAPKIYCIEFAVKTITFSNILCRTVVPGCTRKQYGKRDSCEKISFHNSQVGKLTCNCDFAVAIFRDCLNCFLVYQFYSF